MPKIFTEGKRERALDPTPPAWHGHTDLKGLITNICLPRQTERGEGGDYDYACVLNFIWNGLNPIKLVERTGSH